VALRTGSTLIFLLGDHLDSTALITDSSGEPSDSGVKIALQADPSLSN